MVLVLRRETSRRPSDCGGLPRTRYRRLPANGGVRLEGSAWRARPSHGRSAVSQPSPWHLPNSPVPMTWVSRAGGERHPRVPDAAPGSEISSPAWQERAASWWHPSGGVACQPVVCQPHEDHCALPWQPVLCHLPYAPRLASAIVPSLAPAPTPRHCAESRRVAKRLSMPHHRAKWHMTCWGRKQDLSLDW